MVELEKHALRTVRSQLAQHVREHAGREARIQAVTADAHHSFASNMTAWHGALAAAWEAIATGTVPPFSDTDPVDELVRMASQIVDGLTTLHQARTPQGGAR